ncbi:MAG: DUF3160 domain-containing protein [Bacteroidales bacterium]|nr:DUF3160 domain-containing protein [Bacteroidales bacterium]
MKRILIPCLALTVLAGCGGGNSGNQGNSDAQGNANSDNNAIQTSSVPQDDDKNLPPLKVSDKEFFNGKTKLSKTIDFTEPVESMSYQRLRFMKAYVYASHGFWLKDFDLNTFFSSRTEWYVDACYDRDEKGDFNGSYWDDWNANYDALMKREKLSDEEQEFVEKIDKRIAELTAKRYDARQIANPVQCTNIYQFPVMYDRNSKLWKQLSANNIAFQTTDYEQLFNVYEDNEYHCVPNFVTTDLFLQAFHMYFEYALKLSENQYFTPTLSQLCEEMFSPSLYSEATSDKEKELADFSRTLFGITYKLLNPKKNPILPESYVATANEEINLIMKAEDCPSPLLKTDVNFNYSLFKPRGHYTRNETAKRYFRAMMWLQTASMENSKPEDVSKAIAIAYFYNKISSRDKFENMYDAITYFMGEPDNVSIVWLAKLIRDNYSSKKLSDLLGSNFGAIKAEIDKKFKTCNRIKPKQAVSDPDKLNFMPQRYVPDNLVIANMYDEKPNSDRAYPTGLDVFDAFGVKSAGNILDSTDKNAKSWGDFAKTRKQMSSELSNFKDYDLTSYNKWMQVLITMQNTQKDYPGFMQTPAWECKNLNSALASWAELKHDAILYAEQPMGAECGGGEDFPSPEPVGFVEPNIKFWETLREAIENVSEGMADIGSDNKFENITAQLLSMVDHCIAISKYELKHQPIGEDVYFIQNIGSTMEWFTLSVLDPDVEYVDSWSYVQGADRSIAVVADVFTRNILGCNKQGILYEATGAPNKIFVLVECNGHLYLASGATFSYYEFVRGMGDRLTDEQWQKMLEEKKAPAQPTWFAPLLIDEKIEADETFLYSSGC